MASVPHQVLVVDDEPSMLRYMRTLLELESFRVETAATGMECLDLLKQGHNPDLIFLDLLMPELDGLQTLEQVRMLRPRMKVVMLSCVSDTAKVVQSMRLGAQDYLTKPFEKQSVATILSRYLAPMDAPTSSVSCDVEELDEGHFFLAGSDAMKKIRAEIGLIASVDIPVLMLGESGTGKEIIARLIHKRSQRAHRPFMKVNCAALPADLLESELFGYEAGAFTGANKAKPGKFELCNKGTLLLDEIGEMPVHLQAKLLHVLQDGEFSRLGSRATTKVDVRVLAATNIDVQQCIANKTFREDLYYRLNAFTVNVPPLRERREEIPMLMRHMMSRMAENYGRIPIELSPRIIESCVTAPWPGNLRELGNFIKRFLILGDETLALEELQGMSSAANSSMVMDSSVPRHSGSPVGAAPGDLKRMVRGLKDGAEMEAISRALHQFGWNRKRAAESLQISYKALLYKIRQYNIRPPRGNGVGFVDKEAN